MPTKRVPAINLIQQISKRAEHLTPEEQARSFVSIRRIDGALKNRDSRIIFGRRGTGKTHILSYLSGQAAMTGEVACLIDLRTLGSNNSIYSNEQIASHTRATTLIRDLLDAIHSDLLEIFTDPKSKSKSSQLNNAIERLADCVKSVVVTEAVERRTKNLDQAGSTVLSRGKMSLGLTEASASVDAGLTSQISSSNDSEVTTRGAPKLTVNMGDAAKALEAVVNNSQSRIWFLFDEWSSVPESLQPYLADFIRRVFLPIRDVTVQIAAIEYRSKFRLDFDGQRVGFELGSDISADINLDDYFVYDVNKSMSVDFFRDLLFRHLSTFAGDSKLVEDTPAAVVNSLFSQERVFSELVRASEGVSRDFINILQMAAMRSGEGKINMNEVRSAARDWFERDKQRNLDSNGRARDLLEWIRDKVIDGKKARAFLLNNGVSDHSIDFLFDERMLHIAKRSYSAKDEPGVRYRVWKVDYGCYADLINTVKAPTGFLFDGMEVADTGEIEVPEDDLRAVRRAVLDLSEFESARNFTS